MGSGFQTVNSFVLPDYGWGSKCLFLPGCKKALVLYAHRALFIADMMRGKYDGEPWEISEHDWIDYKTIIVETDDIFFNCKENQFIYRLDLRYGNLTTVVGNVKNSNSAPLAHHGAYLAYVSGNNVNIYSLTENRQITSIASNTDPNSKILFHPSGEFYIFMNSYKIIAYRTVTGIKLWEMNPSEWFTRGDYWGFTPDGRYFILCPYEESIRVCDSFTGAKLATFRKGNDDNVTEAHLSSDGKLLIASSCDGKLRVWDMEKAQKLSLDGTYKPNTYGEDTIVLKCKMDGHKEKTIYSVSPSPDFRRAVTRDERTFYLWDIQGCRLLDQFSIEQPIDDYKIIWHGATASLFVAENTDGVSFDRPKYNGRPYVKISEINII